MQSIVGWWHGRSGHGALSSSTSTSSSSSASQDRKGSIEPASNEPVLFHRTSPRPDSPGVQLAEFADRGHGVGLGFTMASYQPPERERPPKRPPVPKPVATEVHAPVEPGPHVRADVDIEAGEKRPVPAPLDDRKGAGSGSSEASGPRRSRCPDAARVKSWFADAYGTIKGYSYAGAWAMGTTTLSVAVANMASVLLRSGVQMHSVTEDPDDLSHAWNIGLGLTALNLTVMTVAFPKAADLMLAPYPEWRQSWVAKGALGAMFLGLEAFAILLSMDSDEEHERANQLCAVAIGTSGRLLANFVRDSLTAFQSFASPSLEHRLASADTDGVHYHMAQRWANLRTVVATVFYGALAYWLLGMVAEQDLYPDWAKDYQDGRVADHQEHLLAEHADWTVAHAKTVAKLMATMEFLYNFRANAARSSASWFMEIADALNTSALAPGIAGQATGLRPTVTPGKGWPKAVWANMKSRAALRETWGRIADNTSLRMLMGIGLDVGNAILTHSSKDKRDQWRGFVMMLAYAGTEPRSRVRECAGNAKTLAEVRTVRQARQLRNAFAYEQQCMTASASFPPTQRRGEAYQRYVLDNPMRHDPVRDVEPEHQKVKITTTGVYENITTFVWDEGPVEGIPPPPEKTPRKAEGKHDLRINVG